MNGLIVLFLIVGIVLVTISWMRAELKCPPPRIIYKYIPKHQLDVQFGDENKASEVFYDMFVKGTPTQGGYQLGGREYYITADGSRQLLTNMFSRNPVQSPSPTISPTISNSDVDLLRELMRRLNI